MSISIPPELNWVVEIAAGVLAATEVVTGAVTGGLAAIVVRKVRPRSIWTS